jgi:hypothetical protein
MDNNSNVLVIVALLSLGFFWLTAWLFQKIRRREIGVSVNTALLLLIAALLLVPFGMNFSAHLISQVMHDPDGTEGVPPHATHSN